MCQVNRGNFTELYPKIVDAIDRCEFVSLDTEFSGLGIDENDSSKLFDTIEQRYEKHRRAVSQFTMWQIGISCFVKDRKRNHYKAHTFNACLVPCAVAPVDVRFLTQATNINFLCHYKFDFNKLFYEGLSHVNYNQEAQIKELLKSKGHFRGLERDVDERMLQEICSKISEWLAQTKGEDTDSNVPLNTDSNDQKGKPYRSTDTVFTLNISDELRVMPRFLVLEELRTRFPGVWPFINATQLCVETVTAAERRRLEEEYGASAEDEVLRTARGFTPVFRKLVQAKKPLVGHNNLLDLMFIYDKFYMPLPQSYSTFKKEIHAMFPEIYDTKNIALNLRQQQQQGDETNLFYNTSLGELFKSLDGSCQRTPHSPEIRHAYLSRSYEHQSQPHEAGYDAFMCGCVLLHSAHHLALRELQSDVDNPLLTFAQYRQKLLGFRNLVNVIRGKIKYINFAGEDSPAMRPAWLYVTARRRQQLHVRELAQLFSAYGTVDIEMRGPKNALVAAATFRSAKDILATFRSHEEIRVSRYSILRHHPAARRLMWGGLLVSGALCIWALLPDVTRTAKK